MTAYTSVCAGIYTHYTVWLLVPRIEGSEPYAVPACLICLVHDRIAAIYDDSVRLQAVVSYGAADWQDLCRQNKYANKSDEHMCT